MKKIEIKNAVLRKDMLLDIKKPKIAVIMLLFNLLLGLVAVPVIGGLIFTAEGYSYGAMTLSYRTMVYMFLIMVWLETVAICFLTPALTAGCISIEKERQTLDVLLTTKMSTWQIIKGKFFSSITLVLMLIISGLPVMSLVFIYGGINLWQLFLVVLVLIAITMYLASFGVFYSALIKNTIVSVILTYITVGVLFTLTFIGPPVIMAVFALIGEYIESEYNIVNNLNGDIFLLLMWWNPLVTIFDSTAQIFGYGSGSSAINGMVDLGSSDLLLMFTEKNIFLKFWSHFSVIVQLVTSYLLLRWSAYLLKPVKKKPKKSVNTYGAKR